MKQIKIGHRENKLFILGNNYTLFW